MTPADLRRLYRAARAVDTIPDRAAALQARYDHAETILRAALTDAAQRKYPESAHPPVMILPGYRATLLDGRPVVARSAIVDAAQLALWRALEKIT